MIADDIESRGFAFLPTYMWRLPNVIDHIAAELGVRPLSTTHTLSPKGTEHASPNTYSGMFGHDEFPFHTDLAHHRSPPRYVVLRCVIGFTEVATRLLDGRELVAAVGRDKLRRAVVRPRRPVGGQLPLLRLLELSDEGQLIRWDAQFIVPASNGGTAAFPLVRSWISSMRSSDVALAESGDTLIVDNWRILHARSPVDDRHSTRLIERTYLGA